MTSKEEGLLLVDKPPGKTAFSLVATLRRILGVRKIGHAGTLDPFATGAMVMLVGRAYTRLSDSLLSQDKEYEAKVLLGVETDTYDCDGKVLRESNYKPHLEEIEQAIRLFQGEISQIPPMYSAKKVRGQKLYEIARKGREIERKPSIVTVRATILDYRYPYLNLHVRCSKGTYIRSLAYDLGKELQCGAHLAALRRTRSGEFHIDQCLDGSKLGDPAIDIAGKMIKL